MTHAEGTGRVRIRFKQRLQHVDFDTGTLRRAGRARAAPRARSASRCCFGTDGSGSAVRQEMAKRPGYASTQELLSHGYKELTIPAGPGGAFRMEKHALHIWPRGTFMLIALPNEDGSFTCTLFLPFEGPVSFASLDSPREAHGLLRGAVPGRACRSSPSSRTTSSTTPPAPW